MYDLTPTQLIYYLLAYMSPIPYGVLMSRKALRRVNPHEAKANYNRKSMNTYK